jgi:hypothetical protein
VTVLDLSYSPPRGVAGAEALAWLDEKIGRAHEAHREVFFEGLSGPLPPTLLGPWGYSANARGISRDTLRKHLEANYRIVPGAIVEANLSRIDPSGQASSAM